MNNKAKPLFAVLSALIVSSLLLAACSSLAQAPTTSPSEPQATAGANPSVGGSGTQTASDGPKITIARTEPPTLDPGKATDNVSVDIISQLFEGLLQFDDDGQPIPLLAEKWEPSADGLTYTFTLRDGPTWSDGTPVTAKDFEYAWKRNLDPKTASDYATTLYPIKGAEEFNTGKSTDPNTVAVQAKDDKTLVVTLKEPAAYFLRLVSTWTALPLPRQAIEQHGDKWIEEGNIVTNGPYLLKEWKHDSQIVLVRNPNYWGNPPQIVEATYKLFAETDQVFSQMLAAYENGEVDVDRDLPPTDIDRIKNDPKLSQELVTFVESGTYFVVPNSGKAPLDKPEVRQALYLAIDPNAVVENVIRSVSAQPATSVIPPGMPRNESAYQKRPDIDGAKKLLAEAGFPNGEGLRELTFTYNTNEGHKAIAEYLQQAWSQIGVKTKLENMEWKVFLNWRHEADYDIARGGWLSDYEDPNNWYNALLDSKVSDSQLSPHWKNDEFDTLVRRANAELDENKRNELYQQADAILAKEMPFIPVYYYGGQELVSSRIEGWKPSRVMQRVFLKDVTVKE